jgi:hypothetical protein
MLDFIKTLFGFGHKTSLYQQRVPQWDDFIESIRANSEETPLAAIAETATSEIAIEDITFPDNYND